MMRIMKRAGTTLLALMTLVLLGACFGEPPSPANWEDDQILAALVGQTIEGTNTVERRITSISEISRIYRVAGPKAEGYQEMKYILLLDDDMIMAKLHAVYHLQKNTWTLSLLTTEAYVDLADLYQLVQIVPWQPEIKVNDIGKLELYDVWDGGPAQEVMISTCKLLSESGYSSQIPEFSLRTETTYTETKCDDVLGEENLRIAQMGKLPIAIVERLEQHGYLVYSLRYSPPSSASNRSEIDIRATSLDRVSLSDRQAFNKELGSLICQVAREMETELQSTAWGSILSARVAGDKVWECMRNVP